MTVLRQVMCVGFTAVVLFGQANCVAQTVIDSDFAKGDFAALGWKAKGDWDRFRYPDEVKHNPGFLARFAANKPEGSLTKTFPEIKKPHTLSLSLDYGWGWGEAGQGSDSASFMLLDSSDNGYVFVIHRWQANWAVQWAKVANGVPPKDKVWAPVEIDATHSAVRDGGGLSRLHVTRESNGTWSLMCKDWNHGSGATVQFHDTTTSSFTQLVLLGTSNFDEQLFNKIVLSVPPIQATTAIPAAEFLSSIGIVTTFPDRGQPLPKTVEMVKYAGFRWIRGGIEGLTDEGPTTIQTYLDLHRETGAQFSWGLVSGGSDIAKLIKTAHKLAAADALLAFEGNNEPNNWGVTYQNEQGGGRAPSWLAVAKLQRDVYQSVKSDPVLKKYPVWSISEGGAETDNVGLQFLTIPNGAETLLPAGTTFADFANVHNYTYHPGSPGLQDNKTWNASDPTSACKVDGLYGNYGTTWAKHFRGYSETQLLTLPRVTTETGTTIDGLVTEQIQAMNLLSTYLDQFKRGWRYTSVYLLRDREDEAGNQSFGFFKKDYTPRTAAIYLHNLTTILADGADRADRTDGAVRTDKGAAAKPGQLAYSIPEQPVTVHEMLLQQSNGTFELIVWNERLQGSDEVTVNLGATYSAVKVYDPTVGTEPVQIPGRVDSVKLTLSDHPQIIAIPGK